MSVILIVKEEEMECYLLKKSKPINLFLKEITKAPASDRWDVLTDNMEEIDVSKKGVRELFPNCFASAQKKFEIKIEEMDLDDIGEYTKKHHTQVIYWDPEFFDVDDSEDEEQEQDSDSDTTSEDPVQEEKNKKTKKTTKAKKA